MQKAYVWKKFGLIFGPGFSPPGWFTSHSQAPSTLVLEDRVRVFFSGRPPMDSSGQFVSLTGFVDLDKTDPTRILRVSANPVMELGPPGGFDEFGIYPFSAMKRDGVVIAYYGGWTRCESVPFDVAIGMAISRDGGETFERRFPGPVLSKSPFEPYVISGPKIRFFNDKYYLFYIAGTEWVTRNGKPEPTYKIRSATSPDGVTWKKNNVDLIPSIIQGGEAQASPDVIYANGRYHMFFCFRGTSNFRTGSGGYRIGYATSEDLVNWQRKDEKLGLEADKADWESEMMSYPHAFIVGNKTYLTYLGNNFGSEGFGLAELEGELV